MSLGGSNGIRHRYWRALNVRQPILPLPSSH